jgi:hypothetical protein
MGSKHSGMNDQIDRKSNHLWISMCILTLENDPFLRSICLRQGSQTRGPQLSFKQAKLEILIIEGNIVKLYQI